MKLSQINKVANNVINTRKTKASVQSTVFEALNKAKNKALNSEQIFDIVVEYTLKHQRDNWFKTEAQYNEFQNELSNVTDDNAMTFAMKHKSFLKAMNKKVYDLFFNTKHARVISKRYDNVVISGDKIKLA